MNGRFRVAALLVRCRRPVRSAAAGRAGLAGETTVQCLQGRIEFTVPGQVQTLQAGQLLYLRGGEPHSLMALEDACALVTIVLGK